MKNAFIAMLLMTLYLIFFRGTIFFALLGGTFEQQRLYPVYEAIILLTGIIVGAATIIVQEIHVLNETLDKK